MHHQVANILGSEDLSLWQKLNSFPLQLIKINIQTREGLSNFDKPVFNLSAITKKSGLSKTLKVSTLDIQIKRSGLKVSKVPCSSVRTIMLWISKIYLHQSLSRKFKSVSRNEASEFPFLRYLHLSRLKFMKCENKKRIYKNNISEVSTKTPFRKPGFMEILCLKKLDPYLIHFQFLVWIMPCRGSLNEEIKSWCLLLKA